MGRKIIGKNPERWMKKNAHDDSNNIYPNV